MLHPFRFSRRCWAALLLLTALWPTGQVAAQGFHVDYYPALAQNPGDRNSDLEVPPGGWAAPGWAEIFRYGPTVTTSMSRGLVLPPGFNFRFQGRPVTAVRAFANFFLVFDTVQTSVTFINNALPNPTAPNGVAYLGYGWTGGASAATRILTKTFGTAPHRQFWVQWNNTIIANNNSLGVLPGYQSIVLEEGSNRIHFVVHRQFWWGPGKRRLDVGVQLNGTTAWLTDTINIRNPYQNDPRPLDNLTYTFEPGTRPRVDAAMWAVRVPAELLAPGSASTPVRGAVVNRGTQPLVGWRVAYRTGSGPVQLLPVASAPLAPGDTAGFSFPGGWPRPAPGTHRLRVWVQTATAQSDLNPHNDTLARTVQVATRAVARRIVQEIATSSSCPPCAIFDDSLRAVDQRHPSTQIDRIAYPMNFPGAGDPYYLPEFRARAAANQRGVRNVILQPGPSTPVMVANGATVLDPTNRFFFPPLPPYDSLLAGLSGRLAPLALSGTCRVSGDSIKGAVVLDAVVALPPRAYTLLLVATERRTTGNATTNGVTEFHAVAKKILLTRVLTTALVLGQPLTVPYGYFFGPGHTVEHFDSLEVVAFVQHSALAGTGAPADVVQSVTLSSVPRPTLGLTPPVGAAPAWSLAPNPADAGTTVCLTLLEAARVVVEVRDGLGRVVTLGPAGSLAAGAYALPLDLAGVAPGLYLVRPVVAGRPLAGQRLVVTRP